MKETLPMVLYACCSLLALAPSDSGDARVQVVARAGECAWIESGGVLRAHDERQDWDSTVSADGLQVAARGTQAPWTFETGTASFGREGCAAPVARGRTSGVAGRAEIARAGLSEWFDWTAHGLEHGWTIPSPPEGDASRPLWIGLRVGGSLSMHVVHASGAWLKDAQGKKHARYAFLEVTDARGRELPARLMASPHGVGIRIEDAGAAYPITVDPLIDSGWHFETDQAGAGVGSTVTATAGDVNADGYSDVIVATPLYQGPAGVSEGRVWVFHGGPLGPSTTPSWYADGGAANGLFGAFVTSAGDVDGDGDDEIVATANQHGNGKLYVWYGDPSGLGPTGNPGNADFIYESPVAGTRFATQHAAGDFNGDGYGDFAVGRGLGPEQAWVFFGSSGGVVATPWTDVGTSVQPGAGFGSAVASAGDIDADGDDELLVGSPWYDGPGSNTGRVFVYHGGTGFATDHTPDLIVNEPHGTIQQAAFGLAVSSVGDFNGDGFADVGIGAPDEYDGQPGEGFVFVYHGQPGGSLVLGGRREGNANGLALGFGLSYGGDLDGDGFGDFVAGELNPGSSSIHVTYGRPATLGFPGTPGDEDVPTPFGSYTGGNVGSGGDVDGDGFCDVLVPAPHYSGGQSSEGAVFLFLGAPRVPLAEPQPLAAGSATSRTGQAVSSAGDVNADGYNDVVIGAYEFNSGLGRVQVFLGSSSGPNFASPHWTYVGTTPGEHLGWAVSAGDVDNDGRSDIVVGAPNYANGQFDEGRLYLFHSNNGTLPATPTWTYEGDVVGGGLGSAVSALGDVNADGFADIAAGANGQVVLFHGRATSLATLPPATTLTGDQPNSGFGISLALVGDLNLDGFGDLAVGAHLVDNPQVDEGRVYVYLGSYQGITGAVAGTEESQQAGALLGWSIAACGDVNGDGRAEILVGAPGYDAAGSGGAAFLYQAVPAGGGVTLSTLSFRAGAQANGQYGYAVSAGGDVDGDGWNDVLVGAPQWDSAGNDNKGRIYLYLGSSSGLAATASETYDGPLVNAHLGESIALGGDVNGDGLSDPIGGVPSANGNDGGIIALLGGGTTSVRYTTQQRQIADTQAVQLLGRTNDVTGFQLDMGVQNGSGNTATAMGREEVRLQWEVEAIGTLLDGTGVQTQASFVDSGALGGGLRLMRNLSGLTNGTAYHWRARTELNNPYMPHTRWTTIQLDGLQEKKLGLSPDCNGNGVGDSIDIQSATSFDCNANQIPDECDISAQTSDDCQPNTVPDECELFFDCNANQVPDDCDPDCNGNFNPDDCDISGGTSLDTNGDLVPDECQLALMNPLLYCAGDGVPPHANCPCSNNSPAGNDEGCLSSLGTGARLRFSGIARVTAGFDNFTLFGTQMPNSSALYFQGTVQQNAGNGTPFGDGLRCAAGSVLRLGTKINSGGASQYPVAGDLPISIRGAIPAPGGTRYYQIWYRNAAAFCAASTFNLSNGLRATWIP